MITYMMWLRELILCNYNNNLLFAQQFNKETVHFWMKFSDQMDFHDFIWWVEEWDKN